MSNPDFDELVRERGLYDAGVHDPDRPSLEASLKYRERLRRRRHDKFTPDERMLLRIMLHGPLKEEK
jgi:hypothetical protein